MPNTVKPVLSGHQKIDKTKILMTNGSLKKVERIAIQRLIFFFKMHLVIGLIYGVGDGYDGVAFF